MQETEKYKLKKPSTEDFFNIEDFNENTDKIEQALKENAENLDLKIADVNTNFGDIKPHAFLEQISEEYLDNIITEKINNAIQKSMIANNLTTTNPEMVLAAPMGKELKRQLDEQNKNKLDKTEFDNLTIGGRNLALGTSNEYIPEISLFTGIERYSIEVSKVLTDGLKVGDTVTVRLIYKYTDIVPVSGQTAKVIIQGYGNVTLWNDGQFPRSTLELNGSGEYEFLYSFKVTKEQLKNAYWTTSLRHDYIASGSVTWKMFKVEKSTKASDYTPSPEDVQDQINSIQNPTFDDSGTTEGINSFTDFMAKVKSKMNIFEFFKNFKAGMKFILHTGMIVDNFATQIKGFVPDATLVTDLNNRLVEQNNNIGLNKKYIFEDNIDNAVKTIYPNIQYGTNYDFLWRSKTGTSLTSGGLARVLGMYGDDNYESQMMLSYSYKIPLAVRYKLAGKWQNWDKVVLNSDFTRTNLTVDTVANKAVEIPNAPNAPEYLPIIWSVSNTVEHQSTITYNLGKWYVYSNVSQNITIRFHKIP